MTDSFLMEEKRQEEQEEDQAAKEDKVSSEEHQRKAKACATPAIFKRRQATQHLVVQSPTDHIFSPISQKLLQKKRSADTNHPSESSGELKFD